MEGGDRRHGGALSTRRSLLGLAALALAVGGATTWWQGNAARRDGERLAALAGPGDIRMLSSETCVFCAAARRWLTGHRVAFDECFIERDADCRALYEATGARGTPTLLVRGQAQLGFDARRVIAALERAPA
ncbi:MAG TPA: glutaredoxin family protein [Burkholderiaceae bacterium]|nr:glutaredoxin family protein [Burkholderiaceae bacterium]